MDGQVHLPWTGLPATPSRLYTKRKLPPTKPVCETQTKTLKVTLSLPLLP